MAFVQSKPRDEEYAECDARHCALAQFGLPAITLGNCERHGISRAVYEATIYEPEDGSPTPNDYYTFGALSDRLANLPARARLVGVG